MRKNIATFSMLVALAAPGAALAQQSADAEGGEGVRVSRVDVTPYIEAAQVVSKELQPGDDVVTYTRLAAGVDVGFGGRRGEGAVSVRYERRIGYGDVADGDTVSGIARAGVAIVPRAVTLEAGALASRTRVDGNGATNLGAFAGDATSTSQVYSVYAGPSLQTKAGPMEVTGAYRIGYSRVEAPAAVVVTPGSEPADIFDDSLVQMANVRAGFAPGDPLPIGVGVGAGWNRQDISNLDQRIDDKYVRGDVTVPLSRTFALVGGVGYEDVEVSNRDAVRDGQGAPVIGDDGRFITDKSTPRQIAYETEGLIWDVGFMWRPSRRTAVEAHYGHRYGGETYYGSLSYAPNARSSLNLSVYDNLTGLGGQLTEAINNLPTQFDAVRNPITGDLTGCVDSTSIGQGCALARLNSLRSAAFRNRGVTGSYSYQNNRSSFGFGLGYDRRSFIAASGTALGNLDDLVDETYWAAAFAGHELDRYSNMQFTASTAWFESGANSAGDSIGYSATLAYYRQLFGGLSGTAAIGIDGVNRDELPDTSTASALLGLRYSF